MRFVQVATSRQIDATQPTPAQTSQAVSLFVALTVLLLIGVVAVALLTLARRLRRTQPKQQSSTPQADPWREAGRRVEPYDSGDAAP